MQRDERQVPVGDLVKDLLQKKKPRQGIATGRINKDLFALLNRVAKEKAPSGDCNGFRMSSRKILMFHRCKRKSPVRGLQPVQRLPHLPGLVGVLQKKKPRQGIATPKMAGNVRLVSVDVAKEKAPSGDCNLRQELLPPVLGEPGCKRKSPVRGLQRQ